MACVVLLPAVLLSLVLIGVCSLFIYLHLLQEYHAEIEKLTLELQAARDKDGVFLPNERYQAMTEEQKKADHLIREKTLELNEYLNLLDRLKVRNISIVKLCSRVTRSDDFSPKKGYKFWLFSARLLKCGLFLCPKF